MAVDTFGTIMISASDIGQLLQAKHSKDVFVGECKTGPTQVTKGLQIIDAWAMKCSWAHPCCTAYEIKVSRPDFVNDTKWRGYLEYCNEFYFVCPYKMIQVEELSEGTGLLWVSRTGSRLFTKRKAAWRDVEIPDSIFRYILMARSRIDGESQIDGQSNGEQADKWRRWLKQKEENQELGHNVSDRIRQLVAKRIVQVENDNRLLKRANEQLREVKKICDEMGLDHEYISHAQSDVKRAMDKLRGDGLIRHLAMSIQDLQRAHDGLKARLIEAERLHETLPAERAE